MRMLLWSEILGRKSSGPVWWRQHASLALSTWLFALEQLQTRRLRRLLGAGWEAWGWDRRWAEGPGRQAGARDSATGTCWSLYVGGENREMCQRSAGTCACSCFLQRGRRLGSPWEPSLIRCVIYAGLPTLLPGSVCLSFAGLQVCRLESRKKCLLTCCPCLGRETGTPASSVLCAERCSRAIGPHWQRKLFCLLFCAVIPRAFCSTVWLKFLQWPPELPRRSFPPLTAA